MSIAGSGTQQDPWLITTYAELVEKASESGEYLRIENDINITDEYPDGDFPALIIAADIEGNGKKISNWYRTNGDGCIGVTGTTSQVRNLSFANIYFKSSSSNPFIGLSGYNPNYHFVNCEFRGILFRALFDAYEGNGSTCNFSSCSFYINSKYSYAAIVADAYRKIGMRYCYIKVTGSSGLVFDQSGDTFVDSCYIEATMPAGVYDKFTNCVLDITTNTSFTANGSSSNALNIINSDKAPNATAGTCFALVDDEHWLDVNYLNSIGFNAG